VLLDVLVAFYLLVALYCLLRHIIYCVTLPDVILCGIGIQIESRNYVKVYIGPRSLGRFSRFALRNVTQMRGFRRQSNRTYLSLPALLFSYYKNTVHTRYITTIALLLAGPFHKISDGRKHRSGPFSELKYFSSTWFP
jgi:hypothetical protein